MNTTAWIILGLFVLAALYVVVTFNRLVTMRTKVQESFSTLGRVINQKFKELPNLVNTVKGFTAQEKKVLLGVAEVRSSALKVEGTPTKENLAAVKEAETNLTGALKTLFAVSESNPDIKSNQNFLELQRQIEELQEAITKEERYYNGMVLQYNTFIGLFPSMFVAKMFSFQPAELLETAEEVRKDEAKVEF